MIGEPSDFGPVYKRMPESKKHVKNFTELQDIFRNWSNRNGKPVTNRQNRALGREAQKHGIEPYLQVQYLRNNKRITAWRNVTNGQFASMGEKKEKTRLSESERARRVSLRKAQKEFKTREYSRNFKERKR